MHTPNHSQNLSRLAIAAFACASISVACDRVDRSHDVTSSATNTSDIVTEDQLMEPAMRPATKPEPVEKMKAHRDRKPKYLSSIAVIYNDGYAYNQSGDLLFDDDGTISGTTTSDEATVSNGEIAYQLKHVALTPFYNEPASRTPIQIGSTTITGKDKSMAALEMMTPFVDPAARERNLTTRKAVRPVTAVNFNDYGYEDRAEFKSDMVTRLSLIDYRIDDLKASAPQYKDRIAQVDQEQASLDHQIDTVRGVDRSTWNEFRANFRDQIVSLEQEVARLSVATR